MDNLVLISLPISEIRRLIREELEHYFHAKQLNAAESNTSEKLLTVEQAAAFLSLSVSTIYSLVHKKGIPVYKYKRGKRLYFKESELGRWVSEGRKMTAADIDKITESFLAQTRQKGRGNT